MSEMKSRDCHNGEHSSKSPLQMHSWGKSHQVFGNLYLDSLDLIYIWKSFRTPIQATKNKKCSADIVRWYFDILLEVSE